MRDLNSYVNYHDKASDPQQMGTDLRLLDLPRILVQRSANDSGHQAKPNCGGLAECYR